MTMTFVCNVLFLVLHFAMLCQSKNFPWNEMAGMLLTLGQPILGSPPRNLEPPAYMTADEIVLSSGYPVESHTVETDDGYILTLFRIPHGKSGSQRSSGLSIVIIPGILTDGSSFVMNTPDNSAAFSLADAGYDVWLLNFRGTFYSRKHRLLNADLDKKYWDFSFHEMGMYDLPTTVDYILTTTGRDKLYTLGYSMGGAITSIMLSEKPQYQTKVKASFLVAPAMIFRDAKFIKFYIGLMPLLNILGEVLDEREVLQRTPNMVALYQTFCGGLGREMCLNIINGVFGEDYNQFNRTRIEVYMSHILSGTSVKVLRHYLQMYKGFFKHYDYGLSINMKMYGQMIPPDYNIKAIRTPIVIMYGAGDTFVMPDDIIALSRKFRNLIGVFPISYSNFNHLDFMCAKETHDLFAAVLVDQMRKLEGSRYTTVH